MTGNRVLLSVLFFATSAVWAEEPVVHWRTTVDRGRDRGQPFGSLFEARDAKGRLVAGAGFEEVYNTGSAATGIRCSSSCGRQRAAMGFGSRGCRTRNGLRRYLFELDGRVQPGPMPAATGSSGGIQKASWETKLDRVGGLSAVTA
ncbi:MAG: hypothetical protein CM1200mP2_11870 [Planctomycetaceae bacterium]|nr:MAG: hypothetical protein CM1200mP2_11870 [Planctomycetaceae bacterium]